MTPEERARFIVNTVEALAWADNWTTHKALPVVLQQIEQAIIEERVRINKLIEDELNVDHAREELAMVMEIDRLKNGTY